MEKKEIVNIPVELIDRNVNQPRKNFTEEGIEELKNSILEHGIIQPVVVSKNGDRYLIIVGERRFRASLRAGLKEIPCIIESFEKVKIQEVALIENIHRRDLNAIEIAESMKELLEEYNLTQEELSKKINKSRSYIANTIRLLSLPQEVQQLVIDNKLSAGHVRALITIKNKDDLIRLAKKAITKQYNVRDIENEVKLYEIKNNDRKPRMVKPQQHQTIEMQNFISDLRYVLATSVKIIGNEHKGRIYIDYYSMDDLTRISELLKLYKTKVEHRWYVDNYQKLWITCG